MKTTSTVTHLGYLDGLRGLAALFVVFHHTYLQVFGWERISGVAGYALKIFLYGRYSVDVFIALSGFCLMMPIVKGDGTIRGGALGFFQRRAWRILPTYYLALALSLILIVSLIGQKTGTQWDVTLPVTSKSVITHLLLIHDACGEVNTINYPLWSVGVEWRIYFLFPLLLWVWHRVGPIVTTILAVFFSYILFFVCQRFDATGFTSYYIGLFAMGMLSASIAFASSNICRRLRRLPWGIIVSVVTVAVIWVSFAKIGIGKGMPYYLQDGVVGLWTMCLLIMISVKKKGWVYNALSYKPLAFLGTFAYSVYLIHAPLLQVLWQYVFVDLQENKMGMFVVLCLAGIPLIIAASYLFFLICERPFLRRKTTASDSVVVKTALDPSP